MEFENGEDLWDILSESLFELHAAGLISEWAFSDPEGFTSQTGRVGFSNGGMAFTPTAVGVQLWMWAQGMGEQWRDWVTSEPAISPELVPQAAAYLLKHLSEPSPESTN